MRTKTQRSAGTRLRRISASGITKSRLALVAVTAGAASTAGVGGAAAATLETGSTTPEAATVEYELANHAEQALSSAAAQAAPQILAIAEYKPVTGLNEQLTKAADYAAERAAAAQAEAERIAAELAAQADAEAAAQAAAEAEAAAQAAAQTTFQNSSQGSSQNASGSVVKPAQGTFTSGYGPRWGTMHSGIDIAAPIGTPILAVMDGTVIDSGPASGYGQWIRIQHDDGSISVYGHMSTLGVSVGERVSAGQQIAGMGSEGHSTGSHLHFQIHPGGGGPVDPVPWFAQHGIYF